MIVPSQIYCVFSIVFRLSIFCLQFFLVLIVASSCSSAFFSSVFKCSHSGNSYSLEESWHVTSACGISEKNLLEITSRDSQPASCAGASQGPLHYRHRTGLVCRTGGCTVETDFFQLFSQGLADELALPEFDDQQRALNILLVIA